MPMIKKSLFCYQFFPIRLPLQVRHVQICLGSSKHSLLTSLPPFPQLRRHGKKSEWNGKEPCSGQHWTLWTVAYQAPSSMGFSRQEYWVGCYFLLQDSIWPPSKYTHAFSPSLCRAWDEYNCVVVEHSLALPFFGIGMKIDLFQFCVHFWVFQICWHNWVQHFQRIIF